MRLNVFKNIRLSLQLYALVAVTLAIATGLIFYAMQQVKSTQGTLKHTIDNRMVSGQSIQGVADALSMSLEASLDVIEKKKSAIDAHDEIKKATDKARDDWDNYFLGDMIEQEQALADETTPMLDAAYAKIDKLIKKLETNDVADLATWRNETLGPALVDGASGWQRVWSITLPLTLRTVLLVTLISVIGSLLAFDQFYIMTAGQPQNLTATSVFFIYLNSFPYLKLGYGAALSLILAVFVLLFTLVQMLATRRSHA